MAKYGLQTEVTTHIKGMIFSDSPDNQGQNGGGVIPR